MWDYSNRSVLVVDDIEANIDILVETLGDDYKVCVAMDGETALEDAIQALDVRAVFVGNTVNPNLAERVAEDTGTRLVFLYPGSLSEPDGEAPTYPDYIRYNVNAFVQALQ
jgi:CheY-like chemotaxis protein